MNIRLHYDAMCSFVQVSSVTILYSPQLSLNKNVPLSSQTMVHETIYYLPLLAKTSQICAINCIWSLNVYLSCNKHSIIDVKYKNSKNKRRTPFGIRAHFCYSSSSASPSSSGSGSDFGVSTLAFAFASIPASSSGYKNDAIC